MASITAVASTIAVASTTWPCYNFSRLILLLNALAQSLTEVEMQSKWSNDSHHSINFVSKAWNRTVSTRSKSRQVIRFIIFNLEIWNSLQHFIYSLGLSPYYSRGEHLLLMLMHVNAVILIFDIWHWHVDAIILTSCERQRVPVVTTSSTNRAWETWVMWHPLGWKCSPSACPPEAQWQATSRVWGRSEVAGQSGGLWRQIHS